MTLKHIFKRKPRRPRNPAELLAAISKKYPTVRMLYCEIPNVVKPVDGEAKSG